MEGNKRDTEYSLRVKKQVKDSVTNVFVRALEDMELVLKTIEATLQAVGMDDKQQLEMFKDVYENMRKKTLDAGNDAIRDIQNMVGIFNLEVKPEKKRDWIIFVED